MNQKDKNKISIPRLILAGILIFLICGLGAASMYAFYDYTEGREFNPKAFVKKFIQFGLYISIFITVYAWHTNRKNKTSSHE